MLSDDGEVADRQRVQEDHHARTSEGKGLPACYTTQRWNIADRPRPLSRVQTRMREFFYVLDGEA